MAWVIRLDINASNQFGRVRPESVADDDDRAWDHMVLRPAEAATNAAWWARCNISGVNHDQANSPHDLYSATITFFTKTEIVYEYSPWKIFDSYRLTIVIILINKFRNTQTLFWFNKNQQINTPCPVLLKHLKQPRLQGRSTITLFPASFSKTLHTCTSRPMKLPQARNQAPSR